MMKKIKLVSVFILAFLAVFLPASVFALDINYEYPSILWGTTSVQDAQNTTNDNDDLFFYSQTEGNVAVRNVAANRTDKLAFGVFCTLLGVQKPCFSYLNEQNLKVLNARTYINGFLKNTLAVLRPVGVNVFGDSNNASGNYNYWGQHLRATSDNSNSNALWQQKLYQFNPQAQAYWKTDDPNKNVVMTNTINRLKLNSKPANTFLAPGNSWVNPFFDGVCGSAGVSCSESNQYSDGRVWYTAPTSGWGLFANTSSVLYSRKSTFIIESGNPSIREDVQIDRSFTPTDNNSSIGFIATNGDVYIQNLSANQTLTIKANFFIPNGIIHTRGNNIDFVGSFVAKNFDIPGNNINFIQDTRPESAWPPGFRDLQPLTSQSK